MAAPSHSRLRKSPARLAGREQRACRIGFWCLLAAVTLLRLALAGRIGLGVDEAHYLMYARHPAAGYLDHPPMVALLAAPAVIFGGGPLAARLLPILCAAASLVLLRRLALALWSDERIALAALACLLAMPYQHLLLGALLPDAALNLFWTAALLAFWHASAPPAAGRWPAWLLAGLLTGGALLSKYHAALLPLALAGFLAGSRDRRQWLRRPQPWAAAAVALAVYLPNLWWNAQHGFISYRFQLGRGGGGGVDPARLAAALAGQPAVWSPVIFGLLAAAWWVLVRSRPDDRQRFVLWTSLPVFAFFIAAGALVKVLPHWTAAGWWGGSLAVAAVVLTKAGGGGKSAARWRRWATGGAALGLAMCAVLYAGLLFPFVEPLYNAARRWSLGLHAAAPAVSALGPWRPWYEPANETYGWPQVAERVLQARRRMPRPRQTFVFCHRFWEVSQLAAHLPAEVVVTTLGSRVDQYRLWFAPAEHEGWDALFVDVDRRRQGPERYRPLFAQVAEPPLAFTVRRGERPVREVHVYRCFGYRGAYLAGGGPAASPGSRAANQRAPSTPSRAPARTSEG